MKHINRYDNFIRLNEDVEIKGDINEYDINSIKVALLELTDIGWKITNIYDYDFFQKDRYDHIYITLNIKTDKIAHGIYCQYALNKNRLFTVKERKFSNKSGRLINHILSKYERNIVNIIKNSSELLLNILEYKFCHILLDNKQMDEFIIKIDLKNKII